MHVLFNSRKKPILMIYPHFWNWQKILMKIDGFESLRKRNGKQIKRIYEINTFE